MTSLPAVRGLVTVALLKAQFDQGRDHLGMFLPFLLDTARHMHVSNTNAEAIKEAIATRHGLKIPTPTLRTLLKRARRYGISREGGHYFIRPKDLPDTGIEQRKAVLRQEHNALARAFMTFAARNGTPMPTPDAALALIFRFIAQNEVALLLEDSPAVLARQLDKPAKRESHVTARFLMSVALRDDELAGYIKRLLEGFVLQHTLLLSDVNALRTRFDGLSVYLDSGVLFGSLGLLGSTSQTMFREVIALLRKSGARLGVFGVTVLEMERILDVYVNKLMTNEGRLSLHPKPLTRYILNNRLTSSDLKQTRVLLDSRLRSIGVVPSSRPSRNRNYTLDETDLSQRLSAEEGTSDRVYEPRVVHDVDCVAAILTLRRGRTTTDLSRSHAVFVTASRTVLEKTRKWYSDQGCSGLPPVIHWSRIANLAWLRRPAHGATLKVHQLTALCGAALQPDQDTWQRFLTHLKKLDDSNEIDSDESVAILVSSLTEKLLVDLEDEDDLDANSLDEVVERVRKRYAREAESEIAEAKAAVRVSKEIVEGMERRHATLAGIVGRYGSWLITAMVLFLLLFLVVHFTSFTTITLTVLTAISGVSLVGLRRHLRPKLSSWATRLLIP